MKKVSLLMIVLSISLTFIASTTVSIRTNAFTDFKVIAMKYRNLDDLKLSDLQYKTPLLEYVKGELIVYEVEYIKSINSYKPKLDKNNNPIRITDCNMNKLSLTFSALQGFIGTFIEGATGFSNITISFYKSLSNSRDYPEYEVINCYLQKENLSKNLVAGHEYVLKKYVDNLIPNLKLGSVYLLDNDYNFEFFESTNSGYKFNKQIIINPDTIDLRSLQLEFRIGNYSEYSEEKQKGFLWMQKSSSKVVASGKEYEIKNILLTANDKLAVNITTFIHLLFGSYEYDSVNNKEKKITLYKLHSPRAVGKPKMITIKLTTNSAIAYVDGVETKLSFVPYYTENRDVYVPLRDICQLLKINLHYRNTDKSILIERFSPDI